MTKLRAMITWREMTKGLDNMLFNRYLDIPLCAETFQIDIHLKIKNRINKMPIRYSAYIHNYLNDNLKDSTLYPMKRVQRY